METKGFVTLAIHTEKRAHSLKSMLESHDIMSKLEKVTMPYSRQTIGVRVQVRIEDLPLALKLVEKDEPESSDNILELEGLKKRVLIPVDFSEASVLSCKVGFELAERLGLKPFIVHAFTAPVFNPAPNTGDFSADGLDFQNAEEQIELQQQSSRDIKKFRKLVEARQQSGELPKIDFDCEVMDGLPEEVILGCARDLSPALVVMATRGKERKDEELIGSVTAEVIDSCRVPVFTVPDNYDFKGLVEIRRIVLFCHLDQQDIFAVDALMNMFDNPEVDITLIPVDEPKFSKVDSRINGLRDYLAQRYPSGNYSTETLDRSNFREELDHLIDNRKIELLMVPNKKTNIFSRIFKPTIAHKSLFERDVPMLAFPV